MLITIKLLTFFSIFKNNYHNLIIGDNMKKYKTLIISILIPNLLGLLSAIISQISTNINTFNKPSFTPPGIVFPIVWTILYILMGISSYIIYKEKNTIKTKELLIYSIQLLVNFIWSIIFFRIKNFLLAFILIIILLTLVIIMTIKFYKINKTSAYLQIPYILWLILATILSYNVLLLN